LLFKFIIAVLLQEYFPFGTVVFVPIDVQIPVALVIQFILMRYPRSWVTLICKIGTTGTSIAASFGSGFETFAGVGGIGSSG
jgi:hypothetical protein